MLFLSIILWSSDALAGNRPPDLRLEEGRPTRYDLNLDLDPSSETFNGEVVIGLQLDEPTRDLWLHGKKLDIKEVTLEDELRQHPTRVIENAVKGMVPRNRLGRAVLTKLRVYAGKEHPHEAQNPKPIVL